MAHSIPYISRQSAEDLQNSFVRALAEPAAYPVMFYIWGIGGVGKSTLKRRLVDTHCQQADFTEVSFGLTEGINTPIELMAKLHSQLPPLAFWQRDLLAKDPFQTLYDEYQQTANQLQTESIDGKKLVDKEQLDHVKSLLKAGASALGDLMPISGLSKPVLETTAERTVDIAGMLLTEKDHWQQVLQQHRATKKNKELQALMLEPIPKLTKAFAEALVQRSQQTKKTVVLVLDTYEKVTSDLDRWLWQSLLANTQLQPHRVRLVVAGRKSLLDEEAWRKLQQDRNLIFERQLDRFDQSQTQKYLQDIGIKDDVEIAAIFKVTKGLPYYLNWVRQKQEKGKPISFAQGNQGIVKLLLQGLNDKEKQALQIAACCRWFERRLIQHLLEQQSELNWENGQSCYDWLIQREFVEPIQRFYRLDDVARDVFRESLWQESIEQFAQTHKIIADYYNVQGDRVIAPESHVSEKYASAEWCRYKAEALYHICFAANRDIRQVLLTHLFESHYFNQTDVIKTLFTVIASEFSLESHGLLTESTRKFLSTIQPAVMNGSMVLEKEVVRTEELDKLNLSRSQLESTRQICFGQIPSLEGLAKFAALIYKAKIVPKAQRLQWLQQAKKIAEHIVTEANPEFSSGLFLWDLGDAFIEAENYEEVIASYDRAVEIKPDYHEAWYNRGIALDNLGRYEEEIASYDQAVAIKPDLHQAWYNRGVALDNLGRYEEEIASYDQAVAIKPDKHEAWNNRGVALVNLGRNEEAIASYDRAVAIKPDKHEAWNNRGIALGNLGRYEEAIASYDRAVEIKPDFHEAWNNRGIALDNLGRYEEAIASYDRAVAIKPDFHEAWYNRGFALGNLGRYEEAIASYDRAVAIKPDKHEAWNNRGIALGNLGRYEEAIASYDRAVAIKPDDHEAWNNRGIALGNLGRYEEAIASYDRAVEIKPDDHEAWNNRGIALGNLGRYEEAIASYDRAVAIKPDDHEAWNNRGFALDNLGRYEEAIASYDRAVAIKPDFHEAWYNRGFALGNLGRYEEAISSYDKTLEIKPDYHYAWDNRGDALRDLNRYEEAISSYDKALEIKPDYHYAWSSRGYAFLRLGKFDEALASFEKEMEFNEGSAYYDKACFYVVQNQIDEAILNLQKTIEIDSEEYLNRAKTDSDFDNIRHDPRFQALIQ
ncbi:tetratricopeptide repeat protein [Pseudanabaena yagii]|nr:tetratricopeptide repeat protein [Pseudanabaena yagii]